LHLHLPHLRTDGTLMASQSSSSSPLSDISSTLDDVDFNAPRRPETLDTGFAVTGNDTDSPHRRRFDRSRPRGLVGTRRKLSKIANCLVGMDWSLKSFLRAWVKVPSGKRSMEIPFRQWRTSQDFPGLPRTSQDFPGALQNHTGNWQRPPTHQPSVWLWNTFGRLL
jgi:hypothetical protein